MQKLLKVKLPQFNVIMPAHVSAFSSHILLKAAGVGPLNKCDIQFAVPSSHTIEAGVKGTVDVDVSYSKTDAEAGGCRLRLTCTCAFITLPAELMDSPMTGKAIDSSICACLFCTAFYYAVSVHGTA